MGRHGSRRADLVPKQEGGKAHARGNGNHDKAADGGAPETGPGVSKKLGQPVLPVSG